MNELATKAANGTMSLDDRQTVQDEIEQLTTEIDRVAETTKFNEIYLLKGDSNKKTVYVAAHDAGIEGTLTQNSTKATFTMDKLKLGDTISIGGKEYTIGSTKDNVIASLDNLSVGELVTVDGIQYKVVADADSENLEKNELTQANITSKIDDGSTVIYNGKILKAMIIEDPAGSGTTTGLAADTDLKTDYEDTNIITENQAYNMINNELRIASSIGATKEAASVKATAPVAADAKNGKIEFTIDKGKVEKQADLSFSLHVGADADGNNKINVNISAFSAAGLGLDGLNVKDSTGAAATYAIDAIADAISKVSTQRSALGAIQNRLDHTINNLDNVVENTTAAESQIRDTDMATEMVTYSNANILAQAGQSMLAQANQSNQGVLTLLG
jgi:flagellin